MAVSSIQTDCYSLPESLSDNETNDHQPNTIHESTESSDVNADPAEIISDRGQSDQG